MPTTRKMPLRSKKQPEIENKTDSEISEDSDPQADSPSANDEKKKRKKWKRKVSRKQFRHHDIKLFTPGEYRSYTFLKQNEPAPSNKNADVSKEAMTEAIVSSLAGQNGTIPKLRIKALKNAEENNNASEMQNHNNMGKHQLPAIIMETPATRRRSLDKHVPKSSGGMPLLQSGPRSPAKETVPSNVEKPNSSLPNGTTAIKANGKYFQESRNGQINVSSKDVASNNSAEISAKQSNGLSLKRRCSMEIPVDLSKKHIEALPHYLHTTTSSNPPRPPPPPYQLKFPPSNVVVNLPRQPFQTPPKEAFHSNYKYKLHRDKTVTYSPNKERQKYVEPRQTTPPPLVSKRLVKISSLNKWQEMLQHLLKQPFEIELLPMMSQAYQQLDDIKDEECITREMRDKALNILADTYHHIYSKFKDEISPDIDVKGVIKALGASENAMEQKKLMTNLREIQHFRSLNMKSGRQALIIPTSVYQYNFQNRASHDPSNQHQFKGANIEGQKHQEIFRTLPSYLNHPTKTAYNNIEHFPQHLGYLPDFELEKVHQLNQGRKKQALSRPMARPRSKSHRQVQMSETQLPLKRSVSNPMAEQNFDLGYEYVDNKTPYLLSPVAFKPLVDVMLQNGNLNVNAGENVPISNSYSEPRFQLNVQQNSTAREVLSSNYRKRVSPVPVIPQTYGGSCILKANGSYNMSVANQSISSPPSNRTAPPQPDNINKPPSYAQTQINDLKRSPEKSVILPAVIVADTSMQITKEPTLPVAKVANLPEPQEKPEVRLSVITKSAENGAPAQKVTSNSKKDDADQDEANKEILVWLEKLKNNPVLKRKFLKQMGISKLETRHILDYIEIIDSDDEDSKENISKLIAMSSRSENSSVITSLVNGLKTNETEPKPSSERNQQLANNSSNNITTLDGNGKTQEDIIRPRSLEIVSVPLPMLNNSEQNVKSLSKTNFIRPITLPYVYEDKNPNKTIYSPEIEPISPVNVEPIFTFPDDSTKKPSSGISLSLSPSSYSSTLSSPTYMHKNKGKYYSKLAPNEFMNNSRIPRDYLDYATKSLDYIRVPPKGKLCYIRESQILLRYFDDTQVALFIKNLSSQEELMRSTGIDQNELEKSYKTQSNSFVDQTRKSEVIELPKHVEFSTKEDIAEVEEFVKESTLVQQYVPADFAYFYRYVTGFQIVKNNHPVSLKTFLTMYNTNRTADLLQKYLKGSDEDKEH